MGAKIEEVDYERIPEHAKSMRNTGKLLKKQIDEAYAELDKLRNVWYGVRYNELIKGFNKIIPDLDKIMELVITSFPYTLEVVANNYSRADKGTDATSADNSKPTKISEIQPNTKVGMKYLDAEAEAARALVVTKLKNATNMMNNIENIYKKITWKSEASQAFEKTFRELKKKIVEEFQNLEKEFTKQMKAASQDINSAESSNTVK